MSVFTASITEQLTLSGGTNGAWTGANTAPVDRKIFLANGTGANEVQDGHQSTRTLALSTDVDIDLQTEVGAYGGAIALQSLVYLRIEASADNLGDLEVKPGAANGWFGATAAFKTVADTVPLIPGGVLHVECLAATAYAVGPTVKLVNVANIDGTNANSFSVTIIGRK